MQKLELLLVNVLDYGSSRLSLIQLKVIRKAINILSVSIINASVIIFLLLFFIFFNVGVAFWLGAYLGKVYYGFFVVASINVFVGLGMLFLCRKWLKLAIGNYLTKQLFTN